MIQLGDKVKDPITGFEGVAICRAVWLHGCVRINVQKVGELDKENKPIEVTFDEAALVVVEVGAFSPTNNDTRPSGGPDRREDLMGRPNITR